MERGRGGCGGGGGGGGGGLSFIYSRHYSFTTEKGSDVYLMIFWSVVLTTMCDVKFGAV